MTQSDPTIQRVEELIAPYERCSLECDGMTRVLHTALRKASVPHVVAAGKVTIIGQEFSPHFWIELLTNDGIQWIVDYRARMWFGAAAPHGVFQATDAFEYDGYVLEMEALSDFMFKLLTGGMG